MLEVGDKLLCKFDTAHLTAYKMYYVESVSKLKEKNYGLFLYSVFDDRGISITFLEEDSEYERGVDRDSACIYHYFYTSTEARKLKLKTIL